MQEMQEQAKRESESRSFSRTLRKVRDKSNPDKASVSKSFNEFITKENTWLKRKQDRNIKLTKIKDEEETKKFSFKPKITEYSPREMKTMKSKKSKPVWERLYEMAPKNNSIIESFASKTLTI
eukprot:CAMPEP_0168351846 /NCGR_PEP_ID=MMETSP0213-20121227/22160_1 /TAXON_ID=151035 /ORGANISM="Euplotes harpa, Strain FSP1.4" /LENGTH=122 /DNA_ID=CAMNT_0008362867 /DNA_START=499 /DNA_END=864 /DNA_ORIENTATION=+